MAGTLFPTLLAPLFSSAAMRAIMDDRARLQRMLDFQAALARAAAAVGVIPASAAGEIADACRADRYDIAVLAEAATATGTVAAPLVNSLTAEVRKRDPKAAGYVHWGATSQDMIDTALVLELRAAVDALLADHERAIQAFAKLAGRHRRTLMPGRTLLQQALPIPFGLKAAGYAAALARSRDRLKRLRREALALQLGGAAGTLAALGERGLDVSHRLAALLDLPLPEAPWHSHRDGLAEVASAFAILAGTCGKIARDVSLLMQSEVGEVSEPAAPGRGGSSTLPHKRNPTIATAALSAAMLAPNLAATILASQVQEHERGVGGWQSEWMTFPALALVTSGTLSAVADIAEGLEVDAERMKANLERSGGALMAEAVSYALAAKLGRAEAHELVAELLAQADKAKRAFKETVEAEPRVTAVLGASEINALFLPASYLGSSQIFIDRLVASALARAPRRIDVPTLPPQATQPSQPVQPVQPAPPKPAPAPQPPFAPITKLPRIESFQPLAPVPLAPVASTSPAPSKAPQADADAPGALAEVLSKPDSETTPSSEGEQKPV